MKSIFIRIVNGGLGMAIIMLFFAAGLVPVHVSAAEIINKTEVFITADQVYGENLYIGAGRTIIEGTVNADLVVVGGEVTVSGTVTGDIFLFGGSINFAGSVDGDLRIIGGDIVVHGVVGGDVLALGGEVRIASDAIISNEIFSVGGTVFIENNFSNELKVVAGETKINGDLSGSSEITTQYLRVGSDALISGPLSYYAPQKLTQDSGADISGAVQFNAITALRDTNFVKKALLSFISFWFLLRFITTLIIAFILVYLFKVFSQQVADLAQHSFWKSLLIGFVILFLAPLAIIISFISLVALPIGFLIMIALLFIVIISPAISGIFVGNWLQRKLSKDVTKTVHFQSAALGVVVLTLTQFIPFVGGWLLGLLAIASIGAIARYIRIAIIT